MYICNLIMHILKLAKIINKNGTPLLHMPKIYCITHYIACSFGTIYLTVNFYQKLILNQQFFSISVRSCLHAVLYISIILASMLDMVCIHILLWWALLVYWRKAENCGFSILYYMSLTSSHCCNNWNSCCMTAEDSASKFGASPLSIVPVNLVHDCWG